MEKKNLNFFTDIIVFVAFVLLISTGFLIRYTLPSGTGHFGSLWGLDRHQWGSIHFWISIAMMATLAFHLFLHWRWILAMVKGTPSVGSGLRVSLAIVGLLALVALSLIPFFGRLERTEDSPHRIRNSEQFK